MPTRPRSHQIEDISIREFRSVLPAPWVCREKGHDYGVDLEIEVFADNGSATGLTLNVQLKATDDLSKERQVSVSTDRLHYLASLDAPSIVVRYCVPNKTIAWMWSFDALRSAAAGSQSVTLHFGDANRWHQGTPERLLTALQVLRRLKAPTTTACFPLQPIHESSRGDELICEHAMAEVIRALPFVSQNPLRPEQLPIQVTFRQDEIAFQLDPVDHFTMKIDKIDLYDVVDCLNYGLTAIFHKYGYGNQSIAAARCCLNTGRPALHKTFGNVAALALISEPSSAVSLALLNKIHTAQDFDYAVLITNVLGSDASSVEKANAIQQFYRQSIIAHELKQAPCANIYYSLGNSLSNSNKYYDAYCAFNGARRADQGYMNRSYFLREVGGALFLRGRYRSAARAYSCSYAIESDLKTQLCLGDALLFSGDTIGAMRIFEQLENAETVTISKEASLKRALSQWFTEAQPALSTCNLNALISFAREAFATDAGSDAFAASLAVAFLVETDFEVWASTILLAAAHCDEEVFSNVLMCASIRCGMDAYMSFKDKLLALGAEESWLEKFDSMNLEMHSQRHAAFPPPLTVRGL